MLIDDVELETLLAHCCSIDHPAPAPVLCDREARRHQRWRIYGLYASLYWRGRHYPTLVRDMSLFGLGVEPISESIKSGERTIVLLDLEECGILAAAAVVKHLSGGQIGLELLPNAAEDLLPVLMYLNGLALQLEEAASPSPRAKDACAQFASDPIQ